MANSSAHLTLSGIVISIFMWFTTGIYSSSFMEDELGPDYDATLRPGIFEGSPIEVFVHLHVESFGNIQEANMEFQVYSYFMQTWSDKRLAGKINRSVTFKGADIENLWTPDAYCYNARVTNIMLPDSETHSKVSVSPKGLLVYSKGSAFTASCVMDLHSFPHDSQTCYLKFGSYAYDDSDVIFKWLNHYVEVSHDDMAQFTYLGATFATEVDSYSGVNYTTITVSFSFQRRLGYYLLQVYIPDILIVLLSWIVFWLVPDDAGGRLTIGVTTILTVMFLSGGINATMPPVSYAKAMDWYLMVSFGFVFSSVIESLVVFLLSSKPVGKRLKADGMIFHSFKSKKLPSLKARKRTTWRGHRYKTPHEGAVTELSMNIILTEQSLPMSLEDIRIKEEREWHEAVIYRNKRLAIRVDQMSRILFPIAFASYTVVYWISYS